MNKETVLAALSRVLHPQTGKDIVSSGVVEDIVLSDSGVSFTILLPSPQVAFKSELNFACIAAVNEEYPNAEVHVHNTVRTSSAAANHSPLPQVKNIIAVGSGKGGVGKSTVAVNLALGLKALGAKVGIMDADLYGPSLPTMLGLQGKRPPIKQVYGKPMIVPLEAYGVQAISIGFIIEAEQAVVLRGPRLGAIIKQFVSDCLWDDLDFLVIDLPPGTGDIQLTLVQTLPITGVVMVTTPQEVAVVDAIKAMNMFMLPNVNVPILGVVENMAWFTPAELPNNRYYLFGEGGGKRLAKMANTVLLGQIPLVQAIREAGDEGMPALLQSDEITTAAFQQVAEQVLRQTALRNETLAPTTVVGLQ